MKGERVESPSECAGATPTKASSVNQTVRIHVHRRQPRVQVKRSGRRSSVVAHCVKPPGSAQFAAKNRQRKIAARHHVPCGYVAANVCGSTFKMSVRRTGANPANKNRTQRSVGQTEDPVHNTKRWGRVGSSGANASEVNPVKRAQNRPPTNGSNATCDVEVKLNEGLQKVGGLWEKSCGFHRSRDGTGGGTPGRAAVRSGGMGVSAT